MLWLLLALPAAAQSVFPQAAEEPTTSSAATNGDAAAQLIEILRDDAAREALIRQLETRAAESDALSVAPEPEPEPQISLARQIAEHTRGAAEGATELLFDIVGSAGTVLSVFTDSTRINWTELTDAVTSLLLVGAVTLGLFFALRLIGMRIFAAMAARTGDRHWLFMLALIVGSSVVDALIIVLAWAGGYAFALFFGEPGVMDFRQSLFLNAFLLIELVKVALRGIFAPNFVRLRFAPMSDETAAYWYFWSSRLVSLLGYGTLLIVPIINAAISFAIGRSVTVLIVVTALLIAILIVLQNRAPIARALRARHERMPEDLVGRIEAFFAGFWHWLAIAYLVALFLVWTIRPEDALPFMLMATLNSVIAVVVGVVVMALISRAITGGMRLPEDVRETLPLLEERLNAFVPTILKVLRLLVFLVVLLAIAQAWQVMDFMGWLATEVGRDVTGHVVARGRHEGLLERAEQAALARREHAHAVGPHQVVDGLVEGDPLVDAIAEARGHEGHVLRELLDHDRATFWVIPPAEVRVARAVCTVGVARVVDPDRIREVVQRDHGPDAPGHELIDEGVVVGERKLVDLVSPRLDACPLDAEAIRLETSGLHEVDVFECERVAQRSVTDEALAFAETVRRWRGPDVPVHVRVLILDLRGCTRSTEAKATAPGVTDERSELREGWRMVVARPVPFAAGEHARQEQPRDQHVGQRGYEASHQRACTLVRGVRSARLPLLDVFAPAMRS